jgi:transcriptional regulator with XRE-family HTH domain
MAATPRRSGDPHHAANDADDDPGSDSQQRGRVPAPRRAAHPALAFSPDRLRAWRHARATDRPALANAAGITLTDLAAYETGQAHPTPGMIAAWSARLGCQPDQLRSTTPDAPAEYWHAANQAMPRMSAEDLAVVARVFARTAARRAADHTTTDDRTAGGTGTHRPEDG